MWVSVGVREFVSVSVSVCECGCMSVSEWEGVPGVERDHHRAMRVQRRLYSWGSGLLRA